MTSERREPLPYLPQEREDFLRGLAARYPHLCGGSVEEIDIFLQERLHLCLERADLEHLASIDPTVASDLSATVMGYFDDIYPSGV